MTTVSGFYSQFEIQTFRLVYQLNLAKIFMVNGTTSLIGLLKEFFVRGPIMLISFSLWFFMKILIAMFGKILLLRSRARVLKWT